MQLTDKDGNIFGTGGLEITTSSGKPKVPVINTDITIGTTAIVGGVAGRVLFEGAGNVVQESANLSWDDTNGRVTVNTITNGAAAIFKNSTNGFTIYPQSTQVQVYSDYFGAGTDKPLILGTYANRANQLTLFTSGNIGVNTTTDAGFKADINGSTRVSGTLWTDNISPVGSTLYIYSVGASGVGGYNRLNISYSSTNGFVMQSDGGSGGSRNMSIFGGGPGGSLNLGTNGTSRWTLLSSYDALGPGHLVPVGSNTYDIGTPTNTVRYLYSNLGRFSGSLNAATNLAQGVSMSNTLVATANNDVLVGLDVLPTFTNGAFTGVSNFAARFGGDAVFTHGNRSIRVLSPTSGNGGSLSITSGSATTSGTGGDIYLNVGSGAGGPGPGRIYLGNNNGWDVCYVRGLLTINNSGPNTGNAFQVNAGGQNGLTIFWDNLTPYMAYGLVSGRQSRFVNSTSYTFSSKVFIGTNTDAGYNFDVNGTARVQGALTATSVNSSFIGNVSSNQVIQGLGGGTGEFRFVNGAGGGWFFTWCQNSGNATPPNERMRLSSNNNLLIGTTTDAGFRLDVNGSARVQSGLTVSGSLNLNSSDISSAWIAYTPTWSTDGATQPSLGDGTITGAYKVIGKTVFVRVRLVFGTTTTAGTGTFYFSLPVNAAAAWGVQMPASILDNGNAWYQATVNGEYGGLTDRVALIGQSAGGANSSQGVTGVFPIGFGNTDSIQFNGSYESV